MAWHRSAGGMKRSVKPARGAYAFLLAIFLVSCQNMPAEDVLDPTGPGPVKAEETIGSGATSVAMLLPRSGADAAAAADFRHGAIMALDDLGKDVITLTIYDTQSSQQKVQALALKAIENGAKAIIGPVADERVGGVTAIPAERRPPIVTLATNSAKTAPGVFAFASNEIDSALAGLRAAAHGHKLVVLAPEGTSGDIEQHLRLGASKAGADLTAFLRYGKSEPEIRAMLLKNLGVLSKAEAVLILGADSRPATVAGLIRTGLEEEGLIFIGTSAWPAEDRASPMADGVLLALTDQTSLLIVAGRYQERFGRPLSLEAASAYDAVAVATGLVKARGPDGLTIASLTSRSGFRGATGIFRFMPDGHVQRRFALYRIDKGKLTQVRPMPEGF